MRGAVLPVSDLENSWCESECERLITYCPTCLHDAAECNEHTGVLPARGEVGAVIAESPKLAAAMRLLDEAKELGFRFVRTAPGPDAPLLGVRESPDWVDEIVLTGCSREGSRYASRRGRSSLLVPGGVPLLAEVDDGGGGGTRRVRRGW